MSADFFLWGGFVFSLLWHVVLWFRVFKVYATKDFRLQLQGMSAFEIAELENFELDKYELLNNLNVSVTILNFALSGVALCCFGYLAFQTVA